MKYFQNPTETVGRELAPAVCLSDESVEKQRFFVGNAVLSVPKNIKTKARFMRDGSPVPYGCRLKTHGFTANP